MLLYWFVSVAVTCMVASSKKGVLLTYTNLPTIQNAGSDHTTTVRAIFRKSSKGGAKLRFQVHVIYYVLCIYYAKFQRGVRFKHGGRENSTPPPPPYMQPWNSQVYLSCELGKGDLSPEILKSHDSFVNLQLVVSITLICTHLHTQSMGMARSLHMEVCTIQPIVFAIANFHELPKKSLQNKF